MAAPETKVKGEQQVENQLPVMIDIFYDPPQHFQSNE
jgi:hypothetical protein